MPWPLLLAFLFLTWCMNLVAAAAAKCADEAARGVPKDKRGGVSILPVIPLFPLVFFCLAKLVDGRYGPWGTRVVGGLHAVLLVVFLGSIVWEWRKLRSAESDRPADR